MRGSRGREEGGPITVLVFEHVTGGGMAGQEVPRSWAVEGAAMRQAIVDDFASVPGVRVAVTCDWRFRLEPRPGVEVRMIPDFPVRSIESLAAEADYTALIAPETDGVLSGMTRRIEEAGGHPLGSRPEAVDLVGDKGRLAAHFEALGIPTPPTLVIEPGGSLPPGRDGPIVVKPVDGAGSLATFVVPDPRRPPPGLRDLTRAVVQPYMDGIFRSASYLVDREGRATLLAVGRQRIEVDDEGRVLYRGGTIDNPGDVDLSAVERAVDSVPGLRGFVGVDFLDDPRGGVTVLEINPRPTTSYVGLARLFPKGTVAGAWLAARKGELEATDWPDRLWIDRGMLPVTFEADGTIRPDPMDDHS